MKKLVYRRALQTWDAYSVQGLLLLLLLLLWTMLITKPTCIVLYFSNRRKKKRKEEAVGRLMVYKLTRLVEHVISNIDARMTNIRNSPSEFVSVYKSHLPLV